MDSDEDECYVLPAITVPRPSAPPLSTGGATKDSVDTGKPQRSTLRSAQHGTSPNARRAMRHKPINGTVNGYKNDSDSDLPRPPVRRQPRSMGPNLVAPDGSAKKPSIHNVRKYSVVDPSALMYIEDPSSKSKSMGCCGIFLLLASYLIVILTFPLSLPLCIRVCTEYERSVIFRLGRILPHGARGPGLYFVLPCLDMVRKVDLRTVTFDVPPQEVLTKDSVTVAVDAVVYYRIYNPVVAVTNVEDADRSTRLLAATTLRNVLGTKSLAEILSERDSISSSMQVMLDDATDPWGVKVERVEVKDVRLPLQLQRAMAAEAEATREARAKVIMAEGEQKSSCALKEAADVINQSPFALQLRYLQTLNAISAEKNSTIIFPLPIDLITNMVQR